MQPSLPLRIVTWAIAFAVGVVYGVAGTVAQAYKNGWFPTGLVLALIGCAALLVAVRALTQDRWAALATGLGMFAAVVVFSGAGPGGSVIVPQASADELLTTGMVWLFAVPLLIAVVVAWPSSRRTLRANVDLSS